jgi:serine/threonine-protein kinase
MGEVYEAWDRVLGEPVATKVMRATLLNAERLGERFRREVQLARHSTHRGVCRVHDVAFHSQRPGQPLIVLTMELLKGETLADCLSRGPLPRAEALAVATQIADALDAAHAQGVVRGDIKPENRLPGAAHRGPDAGSVDRLWPRPGTGAAAGPGGDDDGGFVWYAGVHGARAG